MKIIEANVDDLKALQTISRQTFKETFEEDNDAADLEKYLEEAYGDEKLGAELANPESFFYLFEVEGELAGYLKLNVGAAQSEHELDDALEVERIYFLKRFKGQGLGKKAISIAHEQAEKLGKVRLWLGVWEHNAPAIDFYKKRGFEEFSEHIFVLGDDRQRDILMKKELNA
ncbi:GNAT family N-acetyltransferase [Fructobacillus sp. M2-14]|uniref:GNAT family N-acetyltransferase n=1 Tax=Fructobacillus broussonetiae TaxID=2713173 RepID=A0ABS5R131_9LACO|nr:GNAT family N-acetyltransferase [Fructobacillus broussonetiae]MBS9339154.1 GNAT family N-acetyltransferase [Fructobacillus broussonetiae]